MNMKQLKTLIIEPVLHDLGMHSKAAINLIIGVVCVESDGGEYLTQLGNGPARGICQTEPATRQDIYDNFLSYRPDLLEKLNAFVVPDLDLDYQLVFNLAYAIAITRLDFYREKEPLPAFNDVHGLALYWKKYYNSEKGAGTLEDFVSKFPVEFLDE